MVMIMIITVEIVMIAARYMLKYTVPCGDDDVDDQDSGDYDGRS